MKGEPNKIPWSSSKQITCNGQQHDGLIIFCNISLWRKPLHHLLPQCFFFFFGACWVMWGKLPVHSWLIDKNILPCQNVVLYWLQQNVSRLQILKTQGLFNVLCSNLAVDQFDYLFSGTTIFWLAFLVAFCLKILASTANHFPQFLLPPFHHCARHFTACQAICCCKA